MLIDTHCHLNFDAFDADRDALFDRAAAAGVTYFINPSVDIASGLAAQHLAAQNPHVFAAAGIHPNSTGDQASGVRDRGRPSRSARRPQQLHRLLLAQAGES